MQCVMKEILKPVSLRITLILITDAVIQSLPFSNNDASAAMLII